MKTESFQDELCMSAFTRDETYLAPACTLTGSRKAGCSSNAEEDAGSIKLTCGRVPLVTSLKYWEIGAILCGSFVAMVSSNVNMLMALSASRQEVLAHP